jgi:hypothetical protein
MYGKHHTEESKRQMSEASKKENLSEETIGRMRDAKEGKTLSEEHRKKIGDALKGKYTGENCPSWKGGISFEPYCHKFNHSFKKSIRDKFGRKCFICNKTEKDNGERLSVHHVSYNKECMCNGVECEFVPTCRSCNSILNSSRDLWERLIINVLNYEGWI